MAFILKIRPNSFFVILEREIEKEFSNDVWLKKIIAKNTFKQARSGSQPLASSVLDDM